MVFDMQVGLSPGDFMLDGNPATTPQKEGEAPPQFSAHFYCGQTAGCIKMALGMEVGLSPRNCVLDRDQPPPQKGCGAPSPIFGTFLLWPNGWMHLDGTWHGDRPHPGGLCVRWGPAPLP